MALEAVPHDLTEHDLSALVVASNGALLATSRQPAENITNHAAKNSVASDVQVSIATGTEAIATTSGSWQTQAATATAMPSTTAMTFPDAMMQSTGQMTTSVAPQLDTSVTTGMPTVSALPVTSTVSIVDAQTTIPFGTSLPGTTLLKDSTGTYSEATSPYSDSTTWAKSLLIGFGITLSVLAVLCCLYRFMNSNKTDVARPAALNRMTLDSKDSEAWRTSRKQQSYRKSVLNSMNHDSEISDDSGRRPRVPSPPAVSSGNEAVPATTKKGGYKERRVQIS